jgi:hypothetical protein
MITLKEYFEITNYRITEGSEFMWHCYGPNAYSLSSWSGEQDGHSCECIFDTHSQTVYQVSVCDYSKERAYRYINPDYVESYRSESNHRDVDQDEAWDDVKYIDLETVEDFIEKATAIVNNEPYDERVQVELDLCEDDVHQLMKLAHEQDITFNELINKMLKEYVESRYL